MATEAQDIVKEEVVLPDTPQINIQEKEPEDKDIKALNHRFETINGIYSKVLAPEIQKNEELKREQKKLLMKIIFVVLALQFIFTYFIVIAIVVIIACSSYLSVSDAVMEALIKFAQFYITAIVVELISILFFIVKNVFDTSIVELFKDFDNNKKKD